METQETFAPYAPAENVLRVLATARRGGIRGAIDVQYLIQLGIEESMAPRSIRALRFLGFINDDGSGTLHLENYITAGDDEAAELLRQAVLRSYVMIFRAVDPTVDPRAKVFNAFRMMKPQGQWHRMVTLFLGLCRAAGMEVKDAPPLRPGRLDAPKERVLRVRSRPLEPELIRRPAPRRVDPSELVSPRSHPRLDPMLSAFVEKLPEIETIDALDAWYKTFKGVFDYVLATRRNQPKLPLENDESHAEA